MIICSYLAMRVIMLVTGVYTRLSYLRSLHVSIVRLCCILDSAADHFKTVDSRLGTIDDLRLLLTALHRYGILIGFCVFFLL